MSNVKYTQQQAEQAYLENGFILNTVYTNSVVAHDCTCILNGHRAPKTLGNAKRFGCQKCSGKAVFSQEEAALFLFKNGFLLKSVYANNKTKCNLECLAKGHSINLRLNDVQCGVGCGSCYKDLFYKNEVCRKMSFRLRNSFNRGLRGHFANRKCSAVDDLGCTLEELVIYIESLWQPGMNWDNWSKTGWHIDHIRPLASFDLENEEEQKKAIHYTNLQPLWAHDNHVKGSKYVP